MEEVDGTVIGIVEYCMYCGENIVCGVVCGVVEHSFIYIYWISRILTNIQQVVQGCEEVA